MHTPLFGHPDAGLMDIGIEQARNLTPLFKSRYGLDLAAARVATSWMRRTFETALEAGVREENITRYPLLDEVSTRLSREEIIQTLHDEVPPPAAIEQIKELRANPPEEEVWFTHGLVIATLMYDCDIPYIKFVPKHGTVIEVPRRKIIEKTV